MVGADAELTRLPGLPPQAYEHPLDRRSLDSLEGTPGLETLVRKCNEWGLERMITVQLMGNHFRVNPDNFPQLYGMMHRACDILDLPKRPQLYIGGLPGLNAVTAGIERPIIALSTAAVDVLSDDELAFVMAHELGHIKSGHVLYRQIAEYLPVICSQLEAVTLGVGKLFSTALEIALKSWERTSELTADRAGLLATQNPDAALSTLMKLAGLPQKYFSSINTEDFVTQARQFHELDGDTLSWIMKALSIMDQTHPWTVVRAHELLRWIDSGQYDQILTAGKALGSPVPDGNALPIPRFCAYCGSQLKAGAAFCIQCGKGGGAHSHEQASGAR